VEGKKKMHLRVKKFIHLMVILLALVETFTGAVIDCVIYTIFYPTSLEHDASFGSDCYFSAYLLPTKHFYRLIIVLYVPILYLWRSHGVGRLVEGSSSGSSGVLRVICTRLPCRIFPATAERLWYWLRALQSTDAGLSVPLADSSGADYNWQQFGKSVCYENWKSRGTLVHYEGRQHNSVIKQYNTRVCSSPVSIKLNHVREMQTIAIDDLLTLASVSQSALSHGQATQNGRMDRHFEIPCDREHCISIGSAFLPSSRYQVILYFY